MSPHQLAIAKASFSAGLLRPDPKPVSRDDIAHFHVLLTTALTECSTTNIQKCKQWILENITQSTARFRALGKYLTALSISFTSAINPQGPTTAKREPSFKRKRLHILYLVNDLLHTKVHSNDVSILRQIQPFLVEILNSAASFRNSPKHIRKIQDLLDIWEEKHYYPTDYIEKLREVARIASQINCTRTGPDDLKQDEITISTKGLGNNPFAMPAVHGDQGAPWYDLPAGNLMPHIMPNSTRPINPSLLKPLQFVAGPPDESLVAAVKDFLQDVSSLFGMNQTEVKEHDMDIDELGQPILRDVITGEILGGEGYYGWSKAFCEKMKRRRNGLNSSRFGRYVEHNRNDPNQSPSGGRSSSNGSRHLKLGRHSESYRDKSGDHSRSRSRNSRQSYSMSSSPRRYQDRASPDYTPSRTLHGSRSRSRSHGRTSWETCQAHHPSNSESRLDSLDTTLSGGEAHSEISHSSIICDQGFLNEHSGPPLLPITHSVAPVDSHNFGPGALHIPPHLPLQYQGQWPPPPHPMLTHSQQNQQNGAWPSPSSQLQHGSQQWQSYKQPPAGPSGWPTTSQRGGVYEYGGPGVQRVAQHQQGRGSGYTGGRDNLIGRGWS